jgi:hypothetical protein
LIKMAFLSLSLSLSAAHLNVNIFPIQFADFYHTRTNIFKGVALDFRFY